MLYYKYTGNELKLNGSTVVANGDILTVRFIEGETVTGGLSCKIFNNTTGEDIPDAIDIYTRLYKYFEPLDGDAGDIDEVEETVTIEDKVNHPSHYTWLKQLCGIEVIDITRHMDFDLGNAIKYILRCGHKEELGYSNKEKTIEDLRKAIFYINDKIRMLERQ